MSNHNWKESYQYKRIQEILEDYWLTEPDEAEVTVCMFFRKADGQTQLKRIVWKNPHLTNNASGHGQIRKLSEVQKPSCFCI